MQSINCCISILFSIAIHSAINMQLPIEHNDNSHQFSFISSLHQLFQSFLHIFLCSYLSNSTFLSSSLVSSFHFLFFFLCFFFFFIYPYTQLIHCLTFSQLSFVFIFTNLLCFSSFAPESYFQIHLSHILWPSLHFFPISIINIF